MGGDRCNSGALSESLEMSMLMEHVAQEALEEKAAITQLAASSDCTETSRVEAHPRD